jgi:hypothetical protein
MSLGYFFGSYYNKAVVAVKRQKLFTTIGLISLALFVVIRLINHFGNFHHWSAYDTTAQTLYSFFDPAKYPPSLTYTLMTLGATFLFLGTTENIKNKVTDFFSVFGKVPFFYYIMHIYVIHLIALLLAQVTGFGWEKMILNEWVTRSKDLVGYGVNLWLVYLIWISVIIILYPFCKRFSVYKMTHKEKWWLSYF